MPLNAFLSFVVLWCLDSSPQHAVTSLCRTLPTNLFFRNSATTTASRSSSGPFKLTPRNFGFHWGQYHCAINFTSIFRLLGASVALICVSTT
ncbi:hypothetical protein C8F04DRAFT_1121915 [Mycena alexandri]|uniref:Secreted protein n=1 Tax=Mycena alexandri TaxID=1745969 RepID=A0AAD6SHC2_9AGAR|nr:hypothetical protein C8F04DRAFT_1121915 [Mycena alexandri]